MRQSINRYIQQNNQFGTFSETVLGTWQDSVGDVFFREIMEPMKDESIRMTTAMEDLSSTLYRIKDEIDMI